MSSTLGALPPSLKSRSNSIRQGFDGSGDRDTDIKMSKHKLSHEDTQTKLSNEDIQIKLSHEDMETKISHENIQTKLSHENIQTKLSHEDIQTKRDKLLKKAKKITKKISKMSHLLEKDEKKFTKFVEHVAELDHDVFNGFKEYDVPAHVVREHQTDVSQIVYESGTHKVVCDVVTLRLSNRNYVTQVEDVTKTLVAALTNYSDISDDVKDALSKDSGFLPALVHTLDAGHRAHVDQEISKTNNLMCVLDCCMKILGNCAMNEKNIPRLRKAGTVRVLLPYRNSHNGLIQLTSLATLAKLVNEEEAENLLFTHWTIFTLLIERLDKAWRSPTHREDWGWDVKELTKTIGQLASNDTNKEVLVHNGCLPLLVEILNSKDMQEVKDSVDALWVLSFDDVNKQKMVDEPNLIKRVWGKYIDDSSDDQIKKSSYGILWSLKDQLKKGKLKFAGIGYVMLSYQWGYQDTIKQICEKLRDDDVPVWIDVDFMEGSTLETMAKAVENCSIFIMAVSQGYKDSSNCRLEAEYAQKLKKPIIPLMMAKDYNPDGWLGIIMGTKLFYEFNGKYPFDNKMSELHKAIRSKMGQGISTETERMIEFSPGSQIDQKRSRPSQEEENQSIVTITCKIYR